MTATTLPPPADSRPLCARRLRRARQARGLSARETVRALRRIAPGGLPGDESLIRTWRRWEAGGAEPGEFYRPLIAAAFGTTEDALFGVRTVLLPPDERDDPADLRAELSALRAQVDRLSALLAGTASRPVARQEVAR